MAKSFKNESRVRSIFRTSAAHPRRRKFFFRRRLPASLMVAGIFAWWSPASYLMVASIIDGCQHLKLNNFCRIGGELIVASIILMSLPTQQKKRNINGRQSCRKIFARFVSAGPVYIDFWYGPRIQTDLSFCLVYMRCFSTGWIFDFGLGGCSILAGRANVYTDLINKNLSRSKKISFEFCYSRSDKKCYDHPKLKFLCVYMDFLDRTELSVRWFWPYRKLGRTEISDRSGM